MKINIVPADSGRAFKQFIDLPWSIYRDDPYWVPPLKSDVRSGKLLPIPGGADTAELWMRRFLYRNNFSL